MGATQSRPGGARPGQSYHASERHRRDGHQPSAISRQKPDVGFRPVLHVFVIASPRRPFAPRAGARRAPARTGGRGNLIPSVARASRSAPVRLPPLGFPRGRRPGLRQPRNDIYANVATDGTAAPCRLHRTSPLLGSYSTYARLWPQRLVLAQGEPSRLLTPACRGLRGTNGGGRCQAAVPLRSRGGHPALDDLTRPVRYGCYNYSDGIIQIRSDLRGSGARTSRH
jgi:hypothetical protein